MNIKSLGVHRCVLLVAWLETAPMAQARQSILETLLMKSESAKNRQTLAQVLLLFASYGLLRYLSEFTLEKLGNSWFFQSPELFRIFRQDNEIILQVLCLFGAMFFLAFFSWSSDALRQALPRFESLQSGLGIGRWLSLTSDSLVKGVLLSSFALMILSISGIISFEISWIFDRRSLVMIVPSFFGQVILLSVWLLALELYRRFLHRVFVRNADNRIVAQCLLILFEAYLVFQVFLKPSYGILEVALLVSVSLIYSLGNLLSYEMGASLSTAEHYRLSVNRWSFAVGYWVSLILIYGAPFISSQTTGFVNILAGPQARVLGVDVLIFEKGHFFFIFAIFFTLLSFSFSKLAVRSRFSLKEKIKERAKTTPANVEALDLVHEY